MKLIILISFLWITELTLAQDFFSKVYVIPEDGTGLDNQYPNWLSAIFTTDSLLYAFGYSADTTYPNVEGTGFYVFKSNGELIEYYHIKDSEKYTYFYPEGISTWDGITFYTSFNNFYHQQSILKFNRNSKSQQVLEIKNILINNGDILRGNLSSTPQGELITASEITIDTTGYNYKIQVTKIDTLGNILWQKVLGNEPKNGFNNHCFSSYVDAVGMIYIGVGYDNDLSLGWRASYQSILYKLDHDGNVVKTYSSKLAQEGFNIIYDITQDDNKQIYLSSNYNYNTPLYPYFSTGYGVIQVLDSSLNYKKIINLKLDSIIDGNASNRSFKKILKANNSHGLIVGGNLPYRDTIIKNIDSLNIDTSYRDHTFLNLLNVSYEGQIQWKRVFRIRNGADDGYLYDLNASPKGGYAIAAASFDLRAPSNNLPYFMPWLLRVDDNGCLIPGCDILNNVDIKTAKEFTIYPNPANNYIVLLHASQEKTHYQIVSAEGRIMDDFYSTIEGEQIIIPISNFKPGSYFVRAESKKGSSSEMFIKQ